MGWEALEKLLLADTASKRKNLPLYQLLASPESCHDSSRGPVVQRGTNSKGSALVRHWKSTFTRKDKAFMRPSKGWSSINWRGWTKRHYSLTARFVNLTALRKSNNSSAASFVIFPQHTTFLQCFSATLTQCVEGKGAGAGVMDQHTVQFVFHTAGHAPSVFAL